MNVEQRKCIICGDRFLAEPIRVFKEHSSSSGKWIFRDFCADCDEMVEVVTETGEWGVDGL